jgi:PAS domain S-box-containing protein
MASSAEVAHKNRELIKQRQTSELFFDHSSDGILIVDDEKRIVDFSRGLEKITGFKKEELLGKIADQALEFSGEGKAPGILNLILLPKNLAKQKYHLPGLLINSLTAKDNRLLQVEINYDNFKDPVSGRLIGIAVLRDITLEKEVRERDREFVSMASHQIFTPLSMVRGFLSLLLNDRTGKLNEKQRDYVSEAYHASKRLVDLVMSLLSTSRIDGQKTELNVSRFDIIKSCRNLIEEIKTSGQLNDNKLSFKSSEKSLFIQADEQKVTQAISNCVENALKYTDKGRVELQVEKNRSDILIKIVDNGIGIPENEIDRVWGKFYRGSNAMKRDTQGTGLGMFITRYMTELHHGKLGIKSEVGKGTEISISLPKDIKH